MVTMFGRGKQDDHYDDRPCPGGGCPRPGTLVTSKRGPDVRLGLGPADAEVVPGLVCGANMSIPGGRAWNLLVDPHLSVENSRNLLQNVWGIRSREDWQRKIERLFEGRYEDTTAERALAIRVQLWRSFGRPPLPEEWLSVLKDSGEVKEAHRIVAYESAFARDGLLPPLGPVRSLYAYDLGRAVHVAFWALATGLVAESTARTVVVLAGKRATERYHSWEDYSAGFSLGRVIFYDNDTYGSMYTSTVRAHHVLASSPDSPWRWLGWPSGGQQI
ncbi:hypothetical protein ABH926_006183 [Catenulispora sp. GP43]